jgi:hypothetical protein
MDVVVANKPKHCGERAAVQSSSTVQEAARGRGVGRSEQRLAVPAPRHFESFGCISKEGWGKQRGRKIMSKRARII